MSPEHFQQQLLTWFDSHGRKDLPWQQQINPYRVWVSEIMLQQTQVTAVIAYFNRFMTRFPNLCRLAEAESDQVLHYWSGLGYYARARNLHKSAQIISAAGGVFPTNMEELIALPGIGRSTAGAILSIACGQSQPILDGNVKRVFSRFHAISGWPGSPKITAELWEISRRHTPLQRCGAYTQAIMDLGATVCTRSKPKCNLCPVATGCQAEKQGLTASLPQAKPRQTLPVKQVYFLLLQNDSQQLLLEKRPPSGIWGGLWSLPEFSEFKVLEDWCSQNHCLLQTSSSLPSQKHRFSHFQLEYTPVIGRLQNPRNYVMEANRSVWYNPHALNSLGLPAPIKRLLQQFTEEFHVKNH